jgi:hypothetical protein
MNFSQTITVIKPVSWETWCFEKTYKIEWAKTGSMNSKVNILLYETTNNTKIMNIVNSIQNNGFFYWKVPKTIIPANHKIVVETVDHLVSGESKTFVLCDCCKFSLKTPPESGDFTAYKNFNLNITWRISDCASDNFIIAVYRVDSNTGANYDPAVLRVGVNRTPTSYLWHIPNNIASGKYRVVLSYGPYFRESTCFTITRFHYPNPNRFRVYDLRVILIPHPIPDPWLWRLHVDIKQVLNYLNNIKRKGNYLIEIIKSGKSIKIGYLKNHRFKWLISHKGYIVNVNFKKNGKSSSLVLSDKTGAKILIKDMVTGRMIKQITLKFKK